MANGIPTAFTLCYVHRGVVDWPIEFEVCLLNDLSLSLDDGRKRLCGAFGDESLDVREIKFIPSQVEMPSGNLPVEWDDGIPTNVYYYVTDFAAERERSTHDFIFSEFVAAVEKAARDGWNTDKVIAEAFLNWVEWNSDVLIRAGVAMETEGGLLIKVDE